MWPIIQRELREQCRQRTTIGLRLAGALVTLAVLLWQLRIGTSGGLQDGRQMFASMNLFLATGLWIICPILTADCLSREKREGTFNLLFLTPLRPLDIVLGKAFVHGWRALSFLIAALPVLAIPILAGGVGWLDWVRLVLTQGSVLALALTAGLLASSLSVGWVQARVMGAIISLCSAVIFLVLWVTAKTMSLGWFTAPSVRWSDVVSSWVSFFDDRISQLGLGNRDPRFSIWASGVGGNTTMLKAMTMGGVWIASLGVVSIMVLLASRQVQRVWRSPPLSPRLASLIRSLTRDRFAQAWWRKRAGRVLDGNPAIWLQNARWDQRLAWGGWLSIWLLVILNGELDGTWLGTRDTGWRFPLADALFVAVAFSAAASYRRERGEGGWELLLVTPLSPRKLVQARFRNLTSQFIAIPALNLGIALWLDGQNLSAYLVAPTLCITGWILTCSAVGLALSCTRMPFVAAFLTTAAIPRLGMFLYCILLSVGFRRDNDIAYRDDMRLFLESVQDWYRYGGFLMALAIAFVGLWFAERALTQRWFISRPVGRRKAKPTE